MGEQFFRPRFTPRERATITEFLIASIDATVTVRARLTES